MRASFLMLAAAFAAVNIFISLGCLPSNTYLNRGSNKDCKPYYRYIRKNFKKNDQQLFIYLSDPVYDTTFPITAAKVNDSCILGLTRKQIKRIFGKPSSEDETTIQYYHRKECFQEGNNRPGCARLIIRFDVKGKANWVSAVVVERKLQY